MRVYRCQIELNSDEIKNIEEYLKERDINAKATLEFSEKVIKINGYEIIFKIDGDSYSDGLVNIVLNKGRQFIVWNDFFINEVNDLFQIIELIDGDNHFVIEIVNKDNKKNRQFYIENKTILENLNDNKVFGMVNYINFNDKAEFMRVLYVVLFKNICGRTNYSNKAKEAIRAFKAKLEYYGYDHEYLIENEEQVRFKINNFSEGTTPVDNGDILDFFIISVLDYLYNENPDMCDLMLISALYNIYYQKLDI